MFDKSHISISFRETPELKDRTTNLVFGVSSGNSSIEDNREKIGEPPVFWALLWLESS